MRDTTVNPLNCHLMLLEFLPFRRTSYSKLAPSRNVDTSGRASLVELERIAQADRPLRKLTFSVRTRGLLCTRAGTNRVHRVHT